MCPFDSGKTSKSIYEYQILRTIFRNCEAKNNQIQSLQKFPNQRLCLNFLHETNRYYANYSFSNFYAVPMLNFYAVLSRFINKQGQVKQRFVRTNLKKNYGGEIKPVSQGQKQTLQQSFETEHREKSTCISKAANVLCQFITLKTRKSRAQT